MSLAIPARSLAFAVILTSSPVFAGGTSSTSYWYGGGLHPLVIERDGVTYRLIGKNVVETLAGGQMTRTYAHADHLGSVRMVTNETGRVSQSVGYDDYGSTRIVGASTASTDGRVASFYRFQGQEQEVFPLVKLGIKDGALAQWLDEIQLYHFPWRDYAAGMATFTETDPIPTQDSLYAALAANPVNVTDETGGMMEFEPLRYSPKHLRIPQRVQVLLDRLREDPSANFDFDEVVELSELRLAIIRQRFNPNNPFEPTEKLIGRWNPRSYSYEINFAEVTEQRRRHAQEALEALRREQNEWLATYSRPIGQLWGRNLRRDMFGNPFDGSRVEESQTDQDEAILEDSLDVNQDRAPSQPPSDDAQISVQDPRVQPVEGNAEDDQKQEHEEWHGDEEQGHHDRPCCTIL
jgi:RHS repeat-associated protein